jgi:hypothetical protein
VEHLTQGYEHHNAEDVKVPSEGIVVVKADSVSDMPTLNRYLCDFDRVVLIVCANEEGIFDTTQLSHPRIKIWLQTPADHQICHRSFPWGWTPECTQIGFARPLNWSFAGQNTHGRRKECIDVLREIRNKKGDGLLYESSSFGTGLSLGTYFKLLSSSKLVPCPSGPLTVDTFRVCEALECGAIPLVDTVSPTGAYGHYWYRVFGERMPFPLIYDWNKLPEVMEQWLNDWETKADTVQKWWQGKKGEWVRQLAEDASWT